MLIFDWSQNYWEKNCDVSVDSEYQILYPDLRRYSKSVLFTKHRMHKHEPEAHTRQVVFAGDLAKVDDGLIVGRGKTQK